MQSADAHRYRVTFAKTDAMRFTGHLDLHRAWERTFRRAELPVVYSQGFSPHPRIQLAAALPLGVIGRAELLDVWLEQSIPSEEILRRLCQASPPGISVSDVAEADPKEDSLQQQVNAAVFEAIPGEPLSYSELTARIGRLLAQQTIQRERRGRPYDLRPLILDLQLAAGPDSRPALQMELLAKEGATGRPEELLAALDLDPALATISRLRLRLALRPEPQPS